LLLRRFKRLVDQSPFRADGFRTVPIRAARFAANRLTREFTTAVVQCRLVPSGAA